jgi:predicted transport protein
MSDIQLFRLGVGGTALELPSHTAPIEKHLQSLIEGQMEVFLGVRFLASEYATGKTHRGRIDSLGIDENDCPVIVEYKRDSKENVMNQGLFYLDWLLDHRAEFRWLVMERLGKDVADRIEWSGTRLLCIAAEFTRYDIHAVQQIPRNIELIRYKLFGDDLLLLELVNNQNVDNTGAAKGAVGTSLLAPITDESKAAQSVKTKAAYKDKSWQEQYEQAPSALQEVFDAVRSFMPLLGDDVQEKSVRLWLAFRRLKNFACLMINPMRVTLTLKLAPATVAMETDFSRDVSQVGHWGTGDVEICLRTLADLEKARPLLERCYAEN